VFVAILPLEASPRNGVFVDGTVFEATNLPTVMRKAYDAALPVLS
jgi:hypothetical protein